MALYEGFDMTFVKMPKYLPTNKYQNKDFGYCQESLTKLDNLHKGVNRQLLLLW